MDSPDPGLALRSPVISWWTAAGEAAQTAANIDATVARTQIAREQAAREARLFPLAVEQQKLNLEVTQENLATAREQRPLVTEGLREDLETAREERPLRLARLRKELDVMDVQKQGLELGNDFNRLRLDDASANQAARQEAERLGLELQTQQALETLSLLPETKELHQLELQVARRGSLAALQKADRDAAVAQELFAGYSVGAAARDVLAGIKEERAKREYTALLHELATTDLQERTAREPLIKSLLSSAPPSTALDYQRMYRDFRNLTKYLTGDESKVLQGRLDEAAQKPSTTRIGGRSVTIAQHAEALDWSRENGGAPLEAFFESQQRVEHERLEQARRSAFFSLPGATEERYQLARALDAESADLALRVQRLQVRDKSLQIGVAEALPTNPLTWSLPPGTSLSSAFADAVRGKEVSIIGRDGNRVTLPADQAQVAIQQMALAQKQVDLVMEQMAVGEGEPARSLNFGGISATELMQPPSSVASFFSDPLGSALKAVRARVEEAETEIGAALSGSELSPEETKRYLSAQQRLKDLQRRLQGRDVNLASLPPVLADPLARLVDARRKGLSAEQAMQRVRAVNGAFDTLVGLDMRSDADKVLMAMPPTAAGAAPTATATDLPFGAPPAGNP